MRSYVATNFSLDRMVNQYVELYSELLDTGLDTPILGGGRTHGSGSSTIFVPEQQLVPIPFPYSEPKLEFRTLGSPSHRNMTLIAGKTFLPPGFLGNYPTRRARRRPLPR